MSNKVLITNSQKAIKVPSGLRILIPVSYTHLTLPTKLEV